MITYQKRGGRSSPPLGKVIYRAYDTKRRRVDTAVAVIFTVAIILAVELWWGNSTFIGALGDARAILYSSVAQLSGALLGFILAAAAIIVGAVKGDAFDRLTKSGEYHTVFAIYFDTVAWLGLATILAFVDLVADTVKHPKPALTFILLFVVCVSAMRVGQCAWVLYRVTRKVADAERDAAQARADEGLST